MKNKKRIFLYIFIVLLAFAVAFAPSNLFRHGSSTPTETIVIEPPKEETPEEKPWDKYFNNETDLSSVREKYGNDEIIAELYIPDLIDVYIAQASDNDYYLNHSLYRKKDIKGSEYMDYRVNKDSKQINLYGHNSSTFNIPFRKLEKFLNKEFFESHPYVILTLDGEERAYEILSIKEVSTDYEHMKVNPDSMIEHIDKLKNNAKYVRNIEYNEDTKLLVMQTCSYAHKDNYYVITAIEVDRK
jgi:SrtB family sortase